MCRVIIAFIVPMAERELVRLNFAVCLFLLIISATMTTTTIDEAITIKSTMTTTAIVTPVSGGLSPPKARGVVLSVTVVGEPPVEFDLSVVTDPSVVSVGSTEAGSLFELAAEVDVSTTGVVAKVGVSTTGVLAGSVGGRVV